VNPLSKGLLLIVILSITGAFKCVAGDTKSNYKTDPGTGVKYLFLKQNRNAVKPVMGDVVFIHLLYKREDDSLLFDSHTPGRSDSGGVLPLTLTSGFKGSLEQGIAMMGIGDSASFLVNADSIYLKVFRLKTLPPYIKTGSYLKFYIKLATFETQEQLKNQQYDKIEQHRAEMQKMQSMEGDSIEKYLMRKNIKVKPIMVDSFYILQRSGIAGRPINEGDSVTIKYTGMLLDGTVFEQSDNGDGGKGTSTFLYRHNAKLIKGWLDVLEAMHEGETMRFLLPSSLAYGSYGKGKDIKPYTPLLYEITVEKVISPFDK
jgi:FKBP-type peptidyl-prolyl cis-trans isomerase FkpA